MCLQVSAGGRQRRSRRSRRSLCMLAGAEYSEDDESELVREEEPADSPRPPRGRRSPRRPASRYGRRHPARCRRCYAAGRRNGKLCSAFRFSGRSREPGRHRD